jgi:hypothetical protein
MMGRTEESGNPILALDACPNPNSKLGVVSARGAPMLRESVSLSCGEEGIPIFTNLRNILMFSAAVRYFNPVFSSS